MNPHVTLWWDCVWDWDWPPLRARGFSFCGVGCLEIRLTPISPGGCMWVAGPASSLQWGELVGGTGKSWGAHFMFPPQSGREHFCDGAGVCPNCLASQAQQSLLAKLKSAYQGSALGLPVSGSMLWLFWGTSFCLVENKLSPTCFSCILLRKRPLCNTAPWDTAGCPEHLSWDVWEHLYSSLSWKTQI